MSIDGKTQRKKDATQNIDNIGLMEFLAKSQQDTDKLIPDFIEKHGIQTNQNSTEEEG